MIRLPVCRTIGKTWYFSQSPNFGCLCVRIGSEVYSIVTYSLSGNSILTTLLTRSSHKNVSIKKSKWFFHLDRSFSLLLLKKQFRKHTSFGKSGSMEKFSRDSNVVLSFADVNATHLSLGLRITKKLRGKDINGTLLFF